MNIQAALVAQKRAPLYDARARAARVGVGKPPVGLGARLATGLGALSPSLQPAGSTAALKQGTSYKIFVQKSDWNYDGSSATNAALAQGGYTQDVNGFMASKLDSAFFPNGNPDHGPVVADASDSAYIVGSFSSNITGTGGGSLMPAFALKSGLGAFWSGLSTVKKVALVGGGVAAVGGAGYYFFMR